MNVDDLNDYRPGAQATKELSICSPLKDAGFTKSEVRAFARDLGVSIWNKPANACLASRIPYGEYITTEKLNRIEAAEDFLHTIGFKQVRVRNQQDTARIEVLQENLALFFNESIINMVATHLKTLGFKCVTLDLSGYIMGSLNSSIRTVTIKEPDCSLFFNSVIILVINTVLLQLKH